MGRSHSSTVTFQCDFAGCNAQATSPGPLPNDWTEANINEVTKEAVRDEKRVIIEPEERSNQTHYLCPQHRPNVK
jgi:hypothetical protein